MRAIELSCTCFHKNKSRKIFKHVSMENKFCKIKLKVVNYFDDRFCEQYFN